MFFKYLYVGKNLNQNKLKLEYFFFNKLKFVINFNLDIYNNFCKQ